MTGDEAFAARAELVRKAQGGDGEALEALVRDSYPGLMRSAMRILRDRDAAEDVVQETLLRLIRNLDQLAEPRAFSSWSGTALRREALEAIRKRSRGLGEPVCIDEVQIDLGALDPEPAFLDREELARTLRRLQKEDRRLLSLHYWYELELKEIAALLGIAVGAVKTRLFRARNRLRDLLCEPEIGLRLPPA